MIFKYDESIVNTLIPDEFGKLIAEKIKSRETMVIKKKKMIVNAMPEFVALFKKTRFISCMFETFDYLLCLGEKGKSNILIRANLKRSREEFEGGQRKLGEEIWCEEKERMTMQIERLKQKIDQMEQMEENYLLDREKLWILFEKGIIDESGIPIHSKEESEMN